MGTGPSPASQPRQALAVGAVGTLPAAHASQRAALLLPENSPAPIASSRIKPRCFACGPAGMAHVPGAQAAQVRSLLLLRAWLT
jgi:hypothetical protein